MLAHIIPETYLKSWKNEKVNSTYVFDKELLIPENKNLNSMSNTLFALHNEYILSYEKCSSHIYQNIYDDLYEELDKKYDIFYKKTKLTSKALRVFVNNIYNEDNIKVFTKQGYEVRITKLKDDIKQFWKKSIETIIENFFNKNYENNWKNLVNFISKNFVANQSSIDIVEYYDYIIEFISIQISRQKDKFQKIYDKVDDIYKSKEQDNNNSIDYWLLELYKFIIFKNDNNKFKYNMVNFIINYFTNIDFQMFILYNDNVEFITSDNPIYHINEKECIVFPITPNMCILIDEKSKNKLKTNVILKEISSDEVKVINRNTLYFSKANVICTKKDIQSLL